MESTDTPRSHVQRRGVRANTRERLIRAGLESVLESGWAGTSVDKVLTTVGVPKGSFYHYFGSKEDFGFALLETYQAYFLRRLERCFGARPNGVNPSFTHKLAAFLSESTVGMRRFRWRRGCLVGTLGQEVAGLHDGFRRRLDASIREWETRLAASIRMAQAEGEVRANFDADRLSRSFWAAWEGAVLRARLARSAAPLVLVVEDFDQLIHI
jgi:TetR/AcrR family transcriptional repressor of nem operon